MVTLPQLRYGDMTRIYDHRRRVSGLLTHTPAPPTMFAPRRFAHMDITEVADDPPPQPPQPPPPQPPPTLVIPASAAPALAQALALYRSSAFASAAGVLEAAVTLAPEAQLLLRRCKEAQTLSGALTTRPAAAALVARALAAAAGPGAALEPLLAALRAAAASLGGRIVLLAPPPSTDPAPLTALLRGLVHAPARLAALSQPVRARGPQPARNPRPPGAS